MYPWTRKDGLEALEFSIFGKSLLVLKLNPSSEGYIYSTQEAAVTLTQSINRGFIISYCHNSLDFIS